ncbi:MAG: DNA repair protein RadA, partial [Pseudomonadales bacterium]|nr:DNA repair protein RadA [Pseudomonadales bacterium]
MSKRKSAYVCNDCGADYTKWQGQCSSCNAWNTMSEVRISNSPVKTPPREGYAGALAEVQVLNEIDLKNVPRISSG